MGVLERRGFSPELIKSMLEDKTLWAQPLEFACKRAMTFKVRDFVKAPSEDEYIDENATLGEAIHQFVMSSHHSLLVNCGDEVGGILRLSDVFTIICDGIKSCAS